MVFSKLALKACLTPEFIEFMRRNYIEKITVVLRINQVNIPITPSDFVREIDLEEDIVEWNWQATVKYRDIRFNVIFPYVSYKYAGDTHYIIDDAWFPLNLMASVRSISDSNIYLFSEVDSTQLNTAVKFLESIEDIHHLIYWIHRDILNSRAEDIRGLDQLIENRIWKMRRFYVGIRIWMENHVDKPLTQIISRFADIEDIEYIISLTVAMTTYIIFKNMLQDEETEIYKARVSVGKEWRRYRHVAMFIKEIYHSQKPLCSDAESLLRQYVSAYEDGDEDRLVNTWLHLAQLGETVEMIYRGML